MTRISDSILTWGLFLTFFLVIPGCISDVSSWGTDSPNITAAPQDADNFSRIIAISTSDTHNLALRANGTILAWNEGGYGNEYCDWGACDIPKNLMNVTAIAAGEGFSAVLTKEGNVVVWGANGVLHRKGSQNITSAGTTGPARSLQISTM